MIILKHVLPTLSKPLCILTLMAGPLFQSFGCILIGACKGLEEVVCEGKDFHVPMAEGNQLPLLPLSTFQWMSKSSNEKLQQLSLSGYGM